MQEKQIEIVLAEPDDFLANIYKKKFEMEGVSVRLVTDGKLLLKEVDKKKPNLIILDVVLPKEDGFKTLEKLKNNTKTKNIPVIFLTSLGGKDDVKKGLELGAVDYLIKTHFSTTEIIDKIKKVLGK